MAAEETDRVESSGVESGGDLEGFGMESETTWGELLFKCSKTLAVVLVEPLLIVLESGPKRFWFKTDADEGIISSSSKLELLLIS
jgi:hypothetical protein